MRHTDTSEVQVLLLFFGGLYWELLFCFSFYVFLFYISAFLKS